MVSLEIKLLSSADIPGFYPEDWSPESNSDIYFALDVEIGEKDQEGSNLFQVMVTTPEGYIKNKDNYDDMFSNRALILLKNYSIEILNETILEILKSCESESWEESVRKLQRYFRWEYEDYVPSD